MHTQPEQISSDKVRMFTTESDLSTLRYSKSNVTELN